MAALIEDVLSKIQNPLNLNQQLLLFRQSTLLPFLIGNEWCEASLQRAGNKTENLCPEFCSLREQVFWELDGVRSMVARSTPQPIKTNTVAAPRGTAQCKADPLGDASKACPPGGEEEAFIYDAWVRVVKRNPIDIKTIDGSR